MQIRISAALLTMLFCGLSAASTPAQANSKFEIREPKIVVRINPSPGPNAKGSKSHNASLEAALVNGNGAIAAGDADDAFGYFEQASKMGTLDPRPLIGM